MSKKDDLFNGYGSNTTVVLEGAVLTEEVLQQAFDKMKESSGYAPDPIYAGNQFQYWNKQHQERCDKFMKYFVKGVVFKEVKSNVEWTVVGTFKNYATKEIGARIRSERGPKHRVKEITMEKYKDFEVISTPPAYKVLFGEQDSEV